MRKNTLNFLLVLALIGVAGYVGKNYQTWFPPEEVSSSEVSEEPSSEVPSEELVLLEEWHFKFSKTQNARMFYEEQVSYYETNKIFGFDFIADNNSVTVVMDDLSLFVEGEDFIIVLDDTGLIASAQFDYSDIDFGLYDFSEIVITAQDQVLTPIYTPLYV